MEIIIIVALAIVAYVVFRNVIKKPAADEQKPAAAPAKKSPAAKIDSTPATPTKATKSATPKAAAKKAPAAKQATTAKTAEKAPAKKAPAAKKAAAKKPAAKKSPAASKSKGGTASIAEQVAELSTTTDPLARHRLFQQITDAAYKGRKNKADREAFLQYSDQHVNEFDAIKAPLKKSNGGKLPHVATFQNYATLLMDDGKFEQAVAVCEQALAHGLDDKTQTGFKGRIERIKAKAAKA